MKLLRVGLIVAVASVVLAGQSAVLRPAQRNELPPEIDGNSAVFWAGGQMFLFHSTGEPHLSSGPDQFQLGNTRKVEFNNPAHAPVWFEAVWRDENGTLLLFYHHEPEARCGEDRLTQPKIGMAVSRDNGATVEDLGIVLESGEDADCDAENGFFSGGHGDLSVVLDREKKYFYIFFTNYAGPLSSQGVVMARLDFAERYAPVGRVKKLYLGKFEEAGLGGRLTAIFPAKESWSEDDTDSYWGPAVHYNKELDRYVMFLNRSCCEPGWPQAGIDVSFSADLADPFSWKKPRRLLNAGESARQPAYYPQVIGLGEGETDQVAGKRARFYVKGISDWEIEFRVEDEEEEPVTDPCASPDIPCSGGNPGGVETGRIGGKDPARKHER
ncbi:MAG: hypothetical protein K7J46_02520 [Bryobacter sp.]|jgi:hypothetical protein|nr:hypothetical protein [Bryobacter sp. CoA8 C33]